MDKLVYVYKITNRINGKKYVGRSLWPDERFKQHMNALRRKQHTCKNFQADYDKYGEEAFEVSVICLKEGLGRNCNEYFYMILYRTYDERYGYNCNDPVMKRYLCNFKEKKR